MLSQQRHARRQIDDPRQICWGLMFGLQDAAVRSGLSSRRSDLQRLSEQSRSSISIPEVEKSHSVCRNTGREADKGHGPGDLGFAAGVTALMGREAAVTSR